MTSYDVVVVGAGPAGLAAAWRAAGQGRSVLVVERADVAGGMAASFDVAGHRVDHGSHRLHPSTRPDLLAQLRRLLGDDLQVRPRHGRIRLAGRWVAFPLEVLDLARHLPPAFSLRAARDAVTRPLRPASDSSFSAVVRSRFGPAVAEAFYEPYALKLWGTESTELSGDLALRRVSAGGPGDIVRRLARPSGSSTRTFLYPRLGFGQITDVLASAAVDVGAELRLGAGVEGLVPGEPHAVRLEGGVSVQAGAVWSTAPAALLPGLVGDRAPADVRSAADRLRHRAMVLVYLVVDRAQYTAFDAHYFPDPAIPVSRLSEPKNYRSSADDPAGTTVLCAEVPCWRGDVVWEAGPDDLAEIVRRALVAGGLPDPAPVEVEARRLPRVYPVYRQGTEADLAAVESWADEHAGLVVFGRQGLFVGDNTHHVLEMGWTAAECLDRDGSFDRLAWRRARHEFRAHVVED